MASPNGDESDTMVDPATLDKAAFAPHYTVPDVIHFCENFVYVDIDMSGELDMDEWETFLSRSNQELSSNDAKLLFMHIDVNRDGTISIGELTPVVFSLATRKQHKEMVRVVRHHVQTLKSSHAEVHREVVGDDELAELFRAHLPRGARGFPVKKLATLCHSLLLPDGVCERHAKSMLEAGVHEIDEEDFLALVADIEREAEEAAEAGARSPTRRLSVAAM